MADPPKKIVDLTAYNADDLVDASTWFGTDDSANSVSRKLSLAELKKVGVQVYNVKQYGAVGDGVADDTTAIQAAIDAIGATGGCLYLPTGVFLASSTLTLPNGDNFTMMGNGNSSVIKSGITDGTALIDCNTAQHFTLKSFKIRASGTGAIANFVGIDMTDANRWSIIDVSVHEGATGVDFSEAYIASIHNLFIRYATLGFTGVSMNDMRGSIHIENVAQGFVVTSMYNSRLDILCEGAARTSSSTLDSVVASQLSFYFEDSTARLIPELAIGGTGTCVGSVFDINCSNFSGSTGPIITVDKCDGLLIRGAVGSNGIYDAVTTTDESKNLKLELVDITLPTDYPVTAEATLAFLRPVNYIPDALFLAAIPSGLSDTRCTSSTEVEIVPPFAIRSLKVAGTVGQHSNYTTKTWTFAGNTHMNDFIGHKLGVGTWVYCNNASFYTHNVAGPDVYCAIGVTTGFTFTADASSNKFTAANHGCPDGSVVTLSTDNTLPAGVTATWYYVVQSTPSTFKVSSTLGGAEIDITDAGTGTHTALPAANQSPFITTNRNQVFVKGKWVFVANELWCPKSATSLAVSYYPNRSATVATADTIAYFVGPVVWIGGLDNALKVLNGDYSEHPDAL